MDRFLITAISLLLAIVLAFPIVASTPDRSDTTLPTIEITVWEIVNAVAPMQYEVVEGVNFYLQ